MKTTYICIILLFFNLQLFADKNNMTNSVESNETLWNTVIDLGVQRLPDYNMDGTNQGYNKNQLFANIQIESRWYDDNDSIWNIGISMKYLGTAIVSDNNTTPNLQPTSFNDVSATLDASIHLQYVPVQFGKSHNLYSELGFITHTGLRSREKKSNSQDTVDWYIDGGAQYCFFRKNPYTYAGNKVANSLPDGVFGIYYRHYSNYNNFQDAKNRTIVELKYKIVPKANFLIGLEANIGKYEDEFYLVLIWRNQSDKLFSLLGINTN